MATQEFSRRALCVALALLLTTTIASAGEVQLSWDPSANADGYRVYRGPSSGAYGPPTDVGNTTSTPVNGLDDCAPSYFAVTAYNQGGESIHSEEVSSWPRAVLTAASPTVVERGTAVAVVVTGTNFRDGDAIAFSNPGLQLTGLTIDACQQMTLSVTVASDAPLGATDVVATHPSGVAGTGNGLFTISPPAPPTVLATSPLDGASDVPLTVQPNIQFSEAVSGVTSSTVRLLDDQGIPVAQAAGSPSMSGGDTVATITPATELDFGSTYRIQAIGGPSGVQDSDGNPLAEDYLQAPGFTTVSDASAPEITDVTATNLTGTSATITWTTDEPADSEVFFRKQGATNYQSVSDSAEVTSHSVVVTGLEPDTTYEFHVSSTDGSGNTTTTTDDSFTTTSSPYTYLRFEAEAGDLVSPMSISNGSDAFAGKWIGTPNGGSTGTPSNPKGTATHGVNIPETDVWFLWVRMYGANGNSNEMYESVDGSTRQVIATAPSGAWSWVEGQGYDLDAGLHSVELGGREGGARADRLLLTNDPDFVPTEEPDLDVTPPAAVSSFTATPATDRINLDWTNPSDGDLETVIVRYRTDGQHPTSPVDGIALVDEPATPGADGSHAHTGITQGITYHYSAFAVDGSGNVSAAAHALGAVTSVPPPPQNVDVY